MSDSARKLSSIKAQKSGPESSIIVSPSRQLDRASSGERRASEPLMKMTNSAANDRSNSLVDLTQPPKRNLTFELSRSKVPMMAGQHGAAAEGPDLISGIDDELEIDEASSPEEDSDLDSDHQGCTDEDDLEDRGRKRTIGGTDSDEDQASNVDSNNKNMSTSPTVTLTPPRGHKSSAKTFTLKSKPPPEHSASRERPMTPTPIDIENLEEIRKAQRLGLAISTTDMPESHKVIRTIIRGDYGHFQDEAKEENICVRTYLLALNMKAEAAYATEWAIGTVLRDGDTLMAIFAVDKDAATGLPEEGLPVGQGGLAMRETTAEVDKMTAAASQRSSRLFAMKSFMPTSRRGSIVADNKHAKRSKRHQERLHALEKLSDMCIDLLRKTKLQVRVVIEVIHCKVARYMLTEAIDVLQPTLVIVGSRGRSLVKGTLAGSFSRYLIMKSSVPVMTARMKVSSKKIKLPPSRIRLGNNLVPSRRFADVKIDELEARLMQSASDEHAAAT